MSCPIRVYQWGLSSVGRASGLKPEGRRLDPVWLHQFYYYNIYLLDNKASFNDFLPKKKIAKDRGPNIKNV